MEQRRKGEIKEMGNELSEEKWEGNERRRRGGRARKKRAGMMTENKGKKKEWQKAREMNEGK